MLYQFPRFRSASLFVATREDEEEPTRTIPDYYELEYLLEGGGTVQINGKTWPTQKGDILVGKPGDRRRCTLPISCLYLHLANVTGDLKQILDSLPPMTHVQDPFYEECFRSIIKLFLSSRTADSLTAFGTLFLMVGKLADLAARPEGVSKQTNRIVARAIRYISINYAENPTIEDVAKHCNVSAAYLHRLFVRVRGVTPHECIMDRKITAAKVLLMNTQKTIAEVAIACGFQSHSYFSDCFKRKVGTTPGKFRSDTSYRL